MEANLCVAIVLSVYSHKIYYLEHMLIGKGMQYYKWMQAFQFLLFFHMKSIHTLAGH